MINERMGDIAPGLSPMDEEKIDSGLKPYHQPDLVYYGRLAELVQINPSAGSDGGTGDCQHV
jgi:hypothetical protein